MRALGVDYGTGSWKMAVLQDGTLHDLVSLPAMEEAVAYVTARAGESPDLPIVLPSGFGVPLMRLQEAGVADLFAMSLLKGDPTRAGLGLFLRRLQQAGVDGYCPPSVKLLPTVPAWRTLNRIDMGTSDKLCAAAYLLGTVHQRDGLLYEALSFLSLEVGYAFKCWLVVQNGRIVDGIGGTAGSFGPRARGAIDGEVAYLHGFASKEGIYGGGWRDLAALVGAGLAAQAFWEGLDLERLALCAHYGMGEIVVSGRRCGEIVTRWSGLSGLTVRTVRHDAEGYEAALGAAMLADGLAGGRWAPLVEHLQLRAARGHPLDGIVWGDDDPRQTAGS